MTTPQNPPPGEGAQGAGAQGAGPSQGQSQGQSQGPGQNPASDGSEEGMPGLAQERTSLAWTRTAIAFAALGGVVLKTNVITGLIIVAIAPVIWQLGRVTRGGPVASDGLPAMPVAGATRLFIIAVTIAAVALLCLIVAIFGKSVPGALR
jgi:uncharacterized membrane protein YidH (DUF202 family)